MIERGPVPPERAVLETVTWPVSAEPQRLDRVACTVFAAFPTRASARKAALRGELVVAGEVSEPARWVAPGTVVQRLEPADANVPVLRRRVPVVFEDDWMAVVRKPGGLATSGNLPRTLERALPFNLKPSSAEDALARPRPAHRLDAPTAGLVAVAKTREALAKLGWAFQERAVEKRYRAVVVGRLDGAHRIEEPIDGRSARTRIEALSHTPALRGGWLTRVDVWPETGRTHQIRRHLAALGTPVLGDAQYGIDGLVLRRKGLFLFALELTLAHPRTDERATWYCDEPGKVGALFARERRRWERWRGDTSRDTAWILNLSSLATGFQGAVMARMVWLAWIAAMSACSIVEVASSPENVEVETVEASQAAADRMARLDLARPPVAK